MSARGTRGIRNNNPLNIRKGGKWQGLALRQNDPEFCTFKSPFWGFRAALKILHTYKTKYNLVTIEEVITRWAPPTENRTDRYIQFVATSVQRPKTDSIWISQGLFYNVVRAMTTMECGEWIFNFEAPLKEAIRQLWDGTL